MSHHCKLFKKMLYFSCENGHDMLVGDRTDLIGIYHILIRGQYAST